MYFRILLPFLLFQSFLSWGQSPFDYGQNKKVYFISTELRTKLGINTMHYVTQHEKGEENGMGGNWSMTQYSFDSDQVVVDWHSLKKGSNFVYTLKAVIEQSRYINGTTYRLADGRLTFYGGGGYGSFENKEIRHYGDTASVGETFCAGHCGPDMNVTFSKNVFNKQGQLLYTVTYPSVQYYQDSMDNLRLRFNPERPDQDSAEIKILPFNPELDSLQQFDLAMKLLVSEDYPPDTSYNKYNAKGKSLQFKFEEPGSDSLKILKPSSKKAPSRTSEPVNQLYIGQIKMEKYIAGKLGFLPELLLIEIYRYGVLSFNLDRKNLKYYEGETIVLEH
jgi:hypothetical protein